MRAGVEMVIGNMCLRQTNQKKVCDERLALRLRASYLCQTPKTSEDTDADAFSGLQMPSFNWPFVSSRLRVIGELRRPKEKNLVFQSK